MVCSFPMACSEAKVQQFPSPALWRPPLRHPPKVSKNPPWAFLVLLPVGGEREREAILGTALSQKLCPPSSRFLQGRGEWQSTEEKSLQRLVAQGGRTRSQVRNKQTNFRIEQELEVPRLSVQSVSVTQRSSTSLTLELLRSNSWALFS